MRLRSIIIIFFILLINAESYSQSAICSYKYRKRISFDPTKVVGPIDLANFPALIKIQGDNDLRIVADGGHVESASGYDIVFTAADGVTLLNFQFEYYGSAAATGGSYTAWVQIPSISTTFSTDIYMYYGNTAIVTDQSSSSVWSNYYGVWHLQNASFTNDNSGNNQTLTNNGTTNQSPAFIDEGRSDNGTNWLEVANTFPNITTNFSFSGWAYTTNNTKAGQRIFCDDVNNTGGYAMSIGDPGTGALRFYSRNSNPVCLDSPNNLVANNTWYYFVAVADIAGGVKSLYINGSVVASGGFVNAWGTDNGNCSIAGETASGETANRLSGLIDEVHVAKTALSADWIATEYNSQSSPSTFYSITTEPYRWIGTTSKDWGVNTNWLGGVVPPVDADVIITNAANQPSLSANVQVKSIWLLTATTLSLSSSSLSFRYDVTNCGTVNGAAGSLIANSTTQAQTEYLSGSGTYNLFNFTINNTFATNPAVVLVKDVNVSGALQLTSGILYTTATYILALSNTASSSSGLATSFVSGPMSKNGATDFVFPVGKGVKWRRCAVTNISAAATYTAEYFNTAYTNTTPVNAPLNNVSLVEYWQCNRSAAGDAKLTLYWEDASLSGINNCPDLTIARWNGASWDERPGTASGSCAGVGAGNIITNAILTAFSPFTFASKVSAVNPLPVSLLTFTAIPIKDQAQIDWSTATENNNDYFTIERTKDGLNMEFVGKLKGKGTTNTINEYSLIDAKPYKGLSYYRLTQTDLNGTAHASPLVALNFNDQTDLNYSLYPNPNTGEFSIQGMINDNAEVTIYNAFGKLVEYKTSSKSNNEIKINCNDLSAGIYFVTIKNDNSSSKHKLIIH